MSSHEACCVSMFWVYLLSCDGLVMFAVLRTHVGSNPRPHVLSIVDLEVLSKAGTLQDRLNTARIMHVVENQHLLLCTLLIGNSLTMEALSIFLDLLVPSFGAILSTCSSVGVSCFKTPRAGDPLSNQELQEKEKYIVTVATQRIFLSCAHPVSQSSKLHKYGTRLTDYKLVSIARLQVPSTVPPSICLCS